MKTRCVSCNDFIQTKCCGIDGPSDWLKTNANQTRFFGEIPQTCCLPEDRKNVTIDGHLMQFCDANDLESIFPGCGEQFTTYSVRKKYATSVDRTRGLQIFSLTLSQLS